MKIRIDIVCGQPGSGKSALIRQMTALSADCGRIIHFDAGSGFTRVTAARLAQLIRQDRPNRVLLESSAEPDAFHPLFALEGLASQAYAGTQAFVINGARFLNCDTAEREYTQIHLRSADIMFVSQVEALPASDKLAILARVWELNRHINVAVEPFQGLDLWKMLDLPSARHYEQNIGAKSIRSIQYYHVQDKANRTAK